MYTNIPTIGPKHIKFRSRIEAQWAYIFESLNWRYFYEPFDLHFYIPDFVLVFDQIKYLCEIKAYIDIWEDENYYQPAIDKIKRSGWEGKWLVFGANYRIINAASSEGSIIKIGICGDIKRVNNVIEDFKFEDVFIEVDDEGTWKLTTDEKIISTDDIEKFERIWADAKNKVQWKG